MKLNLIKKIPEKKIIYSGSWWQKLLRIGPKRVHIEKMPELDFKFAVFVFDKKKWIDTIYYGNPNSSGIIINQNTITVKGDEFYQDLKYVLVMFSTKHSKLKYLQKIEMKDIIINDGIADFDLTKAKENDESCILGEIYYNTLFCKSEINISPKPGTWEGLIELGEYLEKENV